MDKQSRYLILILCLVITSTLGLYFSNSLQNFTNRNNILESFQNENDDIPNLTLSNNLTMLKDVLDRYKTIDIPIIINNSGTLCTSWANYEDNKFNFPTNQCKALPGESDRQCPDDMNLLNSCSIFYSDDYINKQNIIDVNTLIKNAQNQYESEIMKFDENFLKENKKTEDVIDLYYKHKKMETQQNYMIKYNNLNLDEKNKNLQNNKKDIEKSINNGGINKIEFNNFLQKRIELTNQINFYYKIAIYLVIAVFVLALLNYSFNKIYFKNVI